MSYVHVFLSSLASMHVHKHVYKLKTVRAYLEQSIPQASQLPSFQTLALKFAFFLFLQQLKLPTQFADEFAP